MKVSCQLHVPAALFQGRTPSTHWIGGWVDPRNSLEAEAKRKKIPCPFRESNSGRPACSLVTILTDGVILL